jgi:hypothetical protein
MRGSNPSSGPRGLKTTPVAVDLLPLGEGRRNQALPRPENPFPPPRGEGGSLRAFSPAEARRERGHFLAFSPGSRFAFTTSPTNSSGCSCTIALRSRNNRMPKGKSRGPISYRQEIRA